MLEVYIPTYGRATHQATWASLPAPVRARTKLVVQHRERREYSSEYPLLVLPPRVQRIAETREWIVRHHANTGGAPGMVMLDDDLRFDARRMDDGGKFVVANAKQITQMFRDIEAELHKYAAVGVLAREGGNRVLQERVYCTRMMRVLAYDTEVLLRERIRHDRLSVAEDFDVTLQLLRRGYENVVLCNMVQGQGSSMAAGGCSHFRTIELHNAEMKRLAELHAPFVRVVQKQTKGAWQGQARLDVVVAWKKAYASSQA